MISGVSYAENERSIADLVGVWRADFNADGSRVIVQMRSGHIGIWSVESGKIVKGDLGDMDQKGTYQMNPYATQALVDREDGNAQVFDMKTSRAVSPELDIVVKDTWSPNVVYRDEKTIMEFEDAERCQILDVHTGKELATLNVPELSLEREVNPSIQFSKDGKTAVLHDANGVLRRYDTETWKLVGGLMTHPHRDAYTYGFSMTEDATYAVTFDAPGENGPISKLQLWDVKKGQTIGEPISAQNGISGKFFEGGKKLLITPARGEMHVVQVPSLETSYVLPRHDDVEAGFALLTVDQKRIITWGYDSRLMVTDAQSGKSSYLYSGKAHVSSILMGPDPSTVWVNFDNSAFMIDGHNDHYVIRYDLVKQKANATLRILRFLHRIDLSPDGKRLMIQEGNTDRERIRFFDAESLKEMTFDAVEKP